MNNMRGPFNPYNRSVQQEKCTGSHYTGRPRLPANAAVTMAYVPLQVDRTVYDEAKALCAGTLFPVLDKPFLQSGCCK